MKLTDKQSDPITKDVINAHNKILNWLRNNPDEWKSKMDEKIDLKSQGKIRAFQTLFVTPEQCLKGEYILEALEEKDVKTVYPNFEKLIKSINNDNEFCYIFCCCGAVDNGKQALVAPIILCV
jgi:hypothetical protein